ncbi:hypothetical protein EC917_1554 [Bacillus thuringiensis]|uniref:Uncharacterized protein n=1 Tax=Bacillus thuringiensis TaxID=1428 RepID=A0A4V2WBH7_BACTU|nr:hypothetical protein EC917_1554 [Bacillus thuringiensis]TCW43360.1 hypothetical protein EC910_1544 [Bacillus thuringiensis]
MVLNISSYWLLYIDGYKQRDILYIKNVSLFIDF